MIYLNNAATTWPKPERVYREMDSFFRDFGTNPSRSGSLGISNVERRVFEVREKVTNLINASDSSRIIFTSGATESLNLGIKGVLEEGDHVVTTYLEHNSIIRPLRKLEKELGIEVTFVEVDKQGNLDPMAVEEAIKDNTRLVVTTHASNVIGTMVDIKKIGQIAKKNGVIYMVDAAQTAGVFPINVKEMNVDLLVMPGHKSLYGPPGIGVLYIKEGITLDTLMEGGTGSNSLAVYQPEILPDRYESGTQNIIGIVGLGAGIDFINDVGLTKIREHELELTKQFLNEVKSIERVIIYGRDDIKYRTPVIGLNILGEGSANIGHTLEKKFSISVRSGLHCAPLIHKALETIEQGMVRFSLGYFNTKEEIDITLKALKEIVEQNF